MVNSIKFIGIHVTSNISWSLHTDALFKEAHCDSYFLRRFCMFMSILLDFYKNAMEDILSGCITGSSSALDCLNLERGW